MSKNRVPVSGFISVIASCPMNRNASSSTTKIIHVTTSFVMLSSSI